MITLRLFRRHLASLPCIAPICRRSPITRNFRSLTIGSRRWLSTAADPDPGDAFAGLRLQDESVQRFLRSIRTEHDDLTRSDQRSRAGHQRLAQLQPLIDIMSEHGEQQTQLEQLIREMGEEKDADLVALIAEEKQSFTEALARLDAELLSAIFAMHEEAAGSSLIFEVSTGVGGQEAMLFASEIFDMYCGYFAYNGWSADVLQQDRTELGGLRHASAIVTGEGAFERLQFEGGVHRVQRIPATERAGRVHTSTVSVAVIPRPDDLDLNIKPKDLRIETKRASGAGGQHVNTTDSAVRMVHLPTGLAVECQTERSQIKNRELALKKLQAKLVQQYMDKQQADQSSTRKSQVGSSLRNEKIRTYNYNQDRITDHRLSGTGVAGGGTVHNLAGFLEGGECLDELIGRLRAARRKQMIVEMIEKAK